MEKLVYPLWKRPDQDARQFREQLLGQLAPALLDQQVRALRVCVADDAVSQAAGLRQEKLCPAADALVSLWLDTAVYRQPLEAVLAACCARHCGFLVTESAPLAETRPTRGRVRGWTQVVFLERPPMLSEEDWLALWQGSHTAVAIETQSTFAYRQNAVVRQVCGEPLPIHAIVEESFPEAAMGSPHAFYNAGSDEELQRRVEAMIESCARFIDFERITVIPMSDYLLLDFAAGS